MTERDYFDYLNEVLPISTPIGAYCLGFSTVLWRKTGRVPTREFCERLRACNSVKEGEQVYDGTIGQPDGRRSQTPKPRSWLKP